MRRRASDRDGNGPSLGRRGVTCTPRRARRPSGGRDAGTGRSAGPSRRGRAARAPGLTARDYGGTAWVVCPRCPYAAEVASSGRPRRIGDGTDGRFDRPLHLATEVRGHRLWAYDLAHLDALAAWLGAALRERAESEGLS